MSAFQLDIFEHSRDVMLRNDVVAALERGDSVAARSALQTFRAEFAGDESLPSLAVLLTALESQTSAPFDDHDAARDRRLLLQQAIDPAARRMWGAGASTSWLALQWRGLAQRAAALPFQADRSEDHAAPLYLRAGDWQAAIAAVAGIESWRRIPAPLAWMAEARWRADGLDAAWPLLAELSWLSAERFGLVCKRLSDASMLVLHRKFDAVFEGDGTTDDLAWFPAWVLTEQPALAGRLNEAQVSRCTPPEQAMRLVLELLRLERRGRHHDIVEQRKRLRGMNASLFGAYMKTR